MSDAQKIVDSWPDWKRGILEASSSPTVKTPRPVVNIEDRIKTLEHENAELYELAAKLRVENAALRKRLEGT